MANNRIQIKRSSVSGRAANTTTLPNPGEIAVNMADGIMYSTNGSFIFEIGANNTNINVTGNATLRSIVANGSIGTAGQYLTSNGSVVYWSSSAPGSVNLDAQYAWTNTHTWTNAITFQGNTTFGSYGPGGLTIVDADQFVYFNAYGYGIINDTAGNLLTINTSEVNIHEPNANAYSIRLQRYAGLDMFANDHYIRVGNGYYTLINSRGISVGGSGGGSGYFTLNTIDGLVLGNTTLTMSNVNIVANGSNGTAGQVLTSNGTGIYWSSSAPGATNVNAQYTWTNNHTWLDKPIKIINTLANTVGETSFYMDAAGFEYVVNGVSVGRFNNWQGMAMNNLPVSVNNTSTNTYSLVNPGSITLNANGLTYYVDSSGMEYNNGGSRVRLNTWEGLVVNAGGLGITLANAFLSVNGSVGTAGQVLVSNGTRPYWNAPTPFPTAVSLKSPAANDRQMFFYTPVAIPLSSIRSVVVGSTPSATFSINYASTFSGNGTQVVTGGIVCTNVTTGVVTTSFNNGTIAANSYVWLSVNAVSGTVNSLHVALN